MCYIPPLFIATLGPPETDATNMAYHRHIAFLFTFLSSGINPVILCLRAKRFRRALKQLLQDPFGKTTFQETEKEQRVKQIGAYTNECEAEKGKVTHDLVACSFKTYTDEMSLGIQSYKKKKKSENAGTGRRTHSRRNQTTPFSSQDSPPKINSPVAWVDHYPADTAGKSSEEECSTSREDYTQHEITLEVHQEPGDHSQCKTGKCRKSGKAP